MHIPPCFKNDNLENILDFIEKNSFGILNKSNKIKVFGDSYSNSIG